MLLEEEKKKRLEMNNIPNQERSQEKEHPQSIPPYVNFKLQDISSSESFYPEILRLDALISNRYILKQRLGKGTTGEVYLALDKITNRAVALKFLIPEDPWNDNEIDEWSRTEAEIAHKLKHPNIVTASYIARHDLGDSKYITYLVMEMIKGIDLKDWREQQSKPISLESILRFGIQLTDALQYMHGENVVHKDINPSNIMVTPDNKIKLLDFGMARIKYFNVISKRFMASRDYLAPELIENPKIVDVRSDIFSLGAVLFELLFDKPPRGYFPSDKTSSNYIRDQLITEINKALSNNPNDRFQTAGEMGKKLQTMLDSLTRGPTISKEKIEHTQKQAISLINQGNIPAAITLWKELQILDTQSPFRNIILKELKKLNEFQKSIECLKQKAQKLEQHGKLLEALELWHDIKSEIPNDNSLDEKIKNLESMMNSRDKPPVSTHNPHNLYILVFTFLIPACLLAVILWMVGVHFHGLKKNSSTPPTPLYPLATNQSHSSIIEVKSLNYKMIRISAGAFMMGSADDENERSKDEVFHKVTLTKPFYIGATEVSQAQWKKVFQSCNSNFEGDELPVEKITWYDCICFCNRLSQIEGLIQSYYQDEAFTVPFSRTIPVQSRSVYWKQSANGYRLPTEAEWEYACRAGTTTPFYTGENITTDQANYNGNFPYKNFLRGENRKMTVAVNCFSPNAWNLYNMHGNVMEWCWDWYGAYDTTAGVDPRGTPIGSDKVLRGGSWWNYAKTTRSACRNFDRPDEKANTVGLRLVVTLD